VLDYLKKLVSRIPSKYRTNSSRMRLWKNVKRSTIAKEARRWEEVAVVDQGVLGEVAVIFHQAISQLAIGK
jgi:hypothetical protein